MQEGPAAADGIHVSFDTWQLLLPFFVASVPVGAIVSPLQRAAPAWCAGPAGLPGAWCGAAFGPAAANR